MKRWNIEEMMAIGRKLCPSGVRIATQRIRQALQEKKPKFIIRADIKSFYKSISHHKLIQDIKQHFKDDVLILRQTKRSLTRCKQRMMEVLRERGLCLSGKKTRIGSIENGFHFLGINYLGTQPSGNTNVTKAANHSDWTLAIFA